MSRRPRRNFTPEFKAEAVALVRRSGKSPGQVAKELDLTETSLREWLKRADAELSGSQAGPVTDLQSENERLRKELQRVTMERDFLKKAAAFFAKESK